MASPSRYEILAPRLIDGEFNEATAFGSVTWLWLHSDRHRNIPLHTLATLLLPAITQRKFVLVSEAGKPVFYMSWADMDEDAEARYLRNSPEQMRGADWDSGQRMWILDWVAPFGHSRLMSRLIRGRLFARKQFRSLYHKGSDRGLRIKELHGLTVHPQEARAWFDSHPVAGSAAPSAAISTVISATPATPPSSRPPSRPHLHFP